MAQDKEEIIVGVKIVPKGIDDFQKKVSKATKKTKYEPDTNDFTKNLQKSLKGMPGGGAMSGIMDMFSPSDQGKGDKGGKGGGLGSMFGGGGGAGGMMGSIGGGMVGGMLIGGIMKIGKTIMGAVKKGVQLLQEASPVFKAAMGLIKQTIMLIIRPIGDMIGLILIPIIITFYRFFIIPFYQNFYPLFIKYGKEIGGSFAFVGVILAGIMWMFVSLLFLVKGIGEALWQGWSMLMGGFNKLLGVFGQSIGTTTTEGEANRSMFNTGFDAMITDADGNSFSALTMLGDIVDSIFTSSTETTEGAKTNATDLGNTMGADISKLGETVGTDAEDSQKLTRDEIKKEEGFFGDLDTGLTTRFTNLGISLGLGLGKIGGGLSDVAGKFREGLIGMGMAIGTAIKKITGLQTGGIVQSGGLFNLHGKEAVIPLDKLDTMIGGGKGGGAGQINNYISIGNVSTEMDIKELEDRLKRLFNNKGVGHFI